MRNFVAAALVAVALIAPAGGSAQSTVALPAGRPDAGASTLQAIPVGTISPGTAYAGGSANASHARVEFSLDGGKTWSPAPTVKVTRRDGTTVFKKADPSLYTTIRFVAAGALAARAGDVYTYEVRVK